MFSYLAYFWLKLRKFNIFMSMRNNPVINLRHYIKQCNETPTRNVFFCISELTNITRFYSIRTFNAPSLKSVNDLIVAIIIPFITNRCFLDMDGVKALNYQIQMDNNHHKHFCLFALFYNL